MKKKEELRKKDNKRRKRRKLKQKVENGIKKVGKGENEMEDEKGRKREG